MTKNQTFGVRVTLMGPQGSGKTYALKRLLAPESQLDKVYGIFTEAQSLEVFGEDLKHAKFFYKFLPPFALGFDTLGTINKQINTLSNDVLQKLKGIEQGKFTQAIELMDVCNDFIDQHGNSHGCVGGFGTNCAFFIDTLTGLNKMFMSLAIGAKPLATQPDWGVAMGNLQRFIDTLTSNLQCHFFLTAHIEAEFDEISSQKKLMVSTLGRKLAPVLLINMGDIVLTAREGASFFWSTIDSRVDLRTNNLPIRDKLPPDVSILLASWRKRLGIQNEKSEREK